MRVGGRLCDGFTWFLINDRSKSLPLPHGTALLQLLIKDDILYQSHGGVNLLHVKRNQILDPSFEQYEKEKTGVCVCVCLRFIRFYVCVYIHTYDEKEKDTFVKRLLGNQVDKGSGSDDDGGGVLLCQRTFKTSACDALGRQVDGPTTARQ